MRAHEERTTTRIRVGQVAAVVIGSFITYSLIVGLEGTGLHFLELGVLRIVLFAALLAFARWSGAGTRRLGRFGTGLAGVAAATFLGGGIGAVATDGWSLDIFDSETTGAPWYAYVIGLSGMLFALGTILVGVTGRSAGRLAAVVILGGAAFPLAFALGPTAGHVAWLVPWMIIAIGLTRPSEYGARQASPAVEVR